MEKHVHDWVIGAFGRMEDGEVIGYEANPYCIECGKKLAVEDAERRLNATERLSPEQAIRIAHEERPNVQPLRDYAAALEGEDD